MRAKAFGELRFSGRDPIEVIDELRAQWAEYGPLVGADDEAQAARFEDACTRVLDAVGAEARFDEATEGHTRDERGARPKRRGRRDRVAGELPAVPPTAVPQSAPDAVTAPAVLPFEPLPAPPVPAPAPAPPAEEPARRASATDLPPMDELDTGWDMPETDPTAGADETAQPSASEMAGDSATGGDGIDEPGWD